MICMDMDAAALPLYDASEPHRTWKETFGPLLEGKTILTTNKQQQAPSSVNSTPFVRQVR